MQNGIKKSEVEKIKKVEKYRIGFELDNKTWSFSSVNTYQTCPKCFYLTYLQDPPLLKEDNAFAQWGSLGHSIFERYANGKLELFELGSVYENEYRGAVTAPFPPNKFVDLGESYFEKGKHYFENFDGFPDEWEILDSEKEIRLNIDGYEFMGFIDLIVRDKKTGEYIIVDHKSKSKFKDQVERGEYARQLYLYSIFIKDKYGKYPSKLFFNMFRAENTVIIPFDEEELNRTVYWLKDTVESIKKDEKFDDKITILFRKKKKPLKDFKKDDFYCNELCSVRSYCPRSKWFVE